MIGAVGAILAADVAGYSRLIEVDEERSLTRSGIMNEDSGRGLFTTQRKIGSGCSIQWRCHRSLVADALSVRGVPVVEILSESSYRMHRLTPFAQVEGLLITYPPEQATLL